MLIMLCFLIDSTWHFHISVWWVLWLLLWSSNWPLLWPQHPCKFWVAIMVESLGFLLFRVTGSSYCFVDVHWCLSLFSITTTLRPSSICTGTVRSKYTYLPQPTQMPERMITQQQAAKNLKRPRRRRKSPKARRHSRYCDVISTSANIVCYGFFYLFLNTFHFST